MRRYDRFKVMRQINERLNKKTNSIQENMYPGEGSDYEYYDFILQGEFYTDEDAKEHAMGQDWASMGMTQQRLTNMDYIDTVNGVEIYKNYALDMYAFKAAEVGLGEEEMVDFGSDEWLNPHGLSDEELQSDWDREELERKEENLDELSGETVKSAMNQSRDRGQHPRTWRLGELFLHKLQGAELCGGTVNKAYVLNDNDTMRAIIELRTEEGDATNVYDVTNDEWHIRTGAMDRRSARALFKIAQKFNEDTKYANYVDNFQIKGIHEGVGAGQGMILDEATSTMFEKLCGVKVIKESVEDATISPEEANVMLGKVKAHLDSTGETDMLKMDFEEFYLEFGGHTPGLAYSVLPNDDNDDETMYTIQIDFIPKITYSEAPDPGDRWTPPSGGHIEYECRPTKLILLSEEPYYDENGEVKIKQREIETNDPNILNTFFNPSFIVDTERLDEELVEYLIKNGDGGFAEPDSGSNSNSSWVQGYNKYGSDFNPGRDLR
jgi:hypothetical protein